MTNIMEKDLKTISYLNFGIILNSFLHEISEVFCVYPKTFTWEKREFLIET